jgi:putative peptidoglycan lipid II flippase
MSTPPIHRQLAKSAGTIGALTAVSRVLGFIRDIVIATAFGTGLGAEAFVVSFKIPNLLRDLVGEGATNSAFVPVMTECREKKPENFWQLVSTLFFILSSVLLVLTALGVIFAEQIVALLAPGFLQATDPQKYPLTVRLTRVIFPYIFLVGLSALAMGVLNTLKEFKSSAVGPALLNLCIIASAYFFEPSLGPMALVLGVLLGGVFQLGCQVPALLKSGFCFTQPTFEHGFAGKIGKLLLPRALGSALYQINVFVDSILASFESWVGAGGQSALYYSNRIFQLPLAIIGVSLAQAILPTFSTQIVRGDREGFKNTLTVAIRSLMFLVMPASLGLMVWARPIVRTLFEHGKFNAYSTEITSSALFYYAFGLLSCCFIKIFVNAFYAMQDTRTPVKTMMFSVALNVVLSLIFMKWLKIGGLALASSISATVNLGLLYFFLKKKIGPLNESKIIEGFFKMLSAGTVMAVLALAYDRYGLTRAESAVQWVQSAALAAGIVLCALVYFATCRVIGIEESKSLFHGRP